MGGELILLSVQWTKIANTAETGGGLQQFPMQAYQNVATYTPVGGGAILFGGQTVWYAYKANRTFATMASAPLTLRVTQALIVPDPVGGKIIVHGDNNVMYDYNYATNTWTAKSGPTAPPLST